MASNIPVIVQGNSFSLAIPLQIYYINGDQMDLQDYTPDPTDDVTVQLKGSRRNYTYTPTIDGNIANIDLTGNELADNYSVVVSIVKDNGQRLRSFRTDQFFIVESSDDLTTDDIVQGLEENVIYLNSSIFVAGADGRGIESIVKTSTSGLVDTYTIYYTDNTTSTFQVTNGANGQAGTQGVGITSIEKTGTSGLVDTYTITLSNGQTSTFEVTNGQDGHDLGLAVIVDDLTTGGHEDALSAEMGKVLGDGVFTITGGEPTTKTLALEQGTILTGDGTKAPSSSSTYNRRVRTIDFCKVDGEFTISVDAGFLFKMFYYTSADASTFDTTDEWTASNSFTGNYSGYIMFTIKKSTDTNITPSSVTAQVTQNEGGEYIRRIVDNLESTATDMALSANQGKVIGDTLFSETITPTLEQGGLNGSTGEEYPSSDTNYTKRVRSDYIFINGAYSFTLNSGACYNVFLYNNDYSFVGKALDSLTEGTSYKGTWNGYIKLLLSNADKTTTCVPSDFTVSLTTKGLVERVDEIEEQIPDPSSYSNTYIGESIKLGLNKFKNSPYKTLMALHQCFAVYGDFIIIFTYNKNDATQPATAYLYQLSTATLLATLALPNSTYKRPHCNAASFGATFNSANSILPLLYVSQWDNDSQKGCLVYDITLSGGAYSASLVQAILPTNVNTATRGAGQTDWVVDPNGFIYSIGYLLNDGAHTLSNNKTMIAKYKLPAISDGAEVVLGDADVLEHFDVPIYIYRQDAIFEEGRILMLAGATGAVDRRLLAIDPVAKQIVSLVSLDYINKEPEGIGVTDGKLLIGFNGDAVIYRFDFI